MTIEEITKEIEKKTTEASLRLYEVGCLLEDLKDLINTNHLMTYGKYKGKPIRDLPASYVGWLFSSGDLDRWENSDLKRTFKAIFKEEGE